MFCSVNNKRNTRYVPHLTIKGKRDKEKPNPPISLNAPVQPEEFPFIKETSRQQPFDIKSSVHAAYLKSRAAFASPPLTSPLDGTKGEDLSVAFREITLRSSFKRKVAGKKARFFSIPGDVL